MRKSLAYPIRFWALVLTGLLIYQFSTNTAADWCKYEEKIEKSLDLSGSELLEVAAAAGDLKITGIPGASEAVVHGRLCVSKAQWLEEAQIETSGGRSARITVELPDAGGSWSFTGGTYAWMDIEIDMPADLALEVRDSSGDIEINNVSSLAVKDSSGDIEVDEVAGAVTISDSSGDITVERVGGDFTIESDSSGDIRAYDIQGAALVKKDSSGDIRVEQVARSFIVEADSSGDIVARDIGGDFKVLKDGSGEIHSDDVRGVVQIPD